MKLNKIKILAEGYSRNSLTQPGENQLPVINANCSCVLITGNSNVIMDTMTPWDGDFISQALKNNGLTPNDINYVVCTHGHPDHTGSNHLFLKAKQVVGFCISFQDQYFLHPFDKSNREFPIMIL